MAETFNKKEREKKKRQLRQEKEQRKQERKEQSRNGNNLDEMMAYLDADGNLTHLPPDQQHRYHRKPDNNSTKDDTGFRTGTIKFIDYKKGFGFIIDSITHESIFVQTNVLPATLDKTGKVKFKTRQDSRGMSAIFVENIK